MSTALSGLLLLRGSICCGVGGGEGLNGGVKCHQLNATNWHINDQLIKIRAVLIGGSARYADHLCICWFLVVRGDMRCAHLCVPQC